MSGRPKNMRKNQNRRARNRNNKKKNNNQMVRYQPQPNPKPQVIYLKEPKRQESVFDTLGGLLTKGLSALISGFGDYKVNENTLLTGGINPPEVVNSANDGGVIIRHREYLGDVLASTAFTLTRYNINPGVTVTFPWLSNIALSFEQYRLRGMLFEFKSLSSDAVLSSSTSSALGAVIMATQYDALDEAFPNKFTMENYLYANSDKPSCSFVHPVECKRSQTTITELYTRDETIPPNADLRLYDLGVFNIATVGMQAASGVAGELWCTYEIELYKPKVPSLDEGLSQFDHFVLNSPSSSSRLGVSATRSSTSTLGGTIILGSTYIFPTVDVGAVYYCYWQMTGTAANLIGGSNSFVDCSALALFDGDTSFVKQNGGASAVTATCCFVLEITGAAPTFEYGAGTYPTGSTTGDLYVIQMPSSIN